ncbi:AMP-binding protein (plasmid) [Nocardioides sp. R1-1]|uniref:AMP-binding protein n=1 Tax=Nocardioides sp. R1-1 TaxID=3383502 RepID=UPI0038D24991
MVPAMLTALPRLPGFFDTDLSRIRSLVVAGAPVPPALIQQFSDQGLTLQQAWRMTETAPFATHLPEEQTVTKLGSAGIPLPHTGVQVVDTETGAVLSPGSSGEIAVRGPHVTPGYWQNPEATALAFDDERWFHSGDIGYLGEDGYLFIVDRLKDMIMSGGEDVYPAEVERALADLDGVTDVVIIGVPDDDSGEDGRCRGLDRRRPRGHHSTPCGGTPGLRSPIPAPDRQAVPRNASGKLDKLSIRALVEET